MFQQLPQPSIIAHRGSSVYAPENTIAAFELAVIQKADAIELDVKLCADGQVVVIHDQTVDRTTNGTGNLSELSLSALKELDAGNWFRAEFNGEFIPTLEEVFEAVGNRIFINIELTNYASIRDDLPEKVIDLVKKHGMDERVLFSSFNPLALRKAHRLLPNSPIGLLAFPGFWGFWARSRMGRWLVPYTALHPEKRDTTAKLINQHHKRKNRIYSWTVNDPKVMYNHFEWGVDGIITDDPPLAIQIRGQELP